MTAKSTQTASSDPLVEGFRGLETASISDALDRLRLPGSALGIAPLLSHGQRMVGRAYTVRYVPVGAVKGTVGDYIDDVEPGQVIVLDNQGRLYCTVWGDILTAMASNRGIAGTAIWGVCRDVAKAFELNYPLYSSSRFMRTGKDRVEVADVQVPVALGDAQVRPGDLIVGDDDGIVIVPQGHEERLLEVARGIVEQEDAILDEILNGSTIAQARKRHGYHILQRAET
jgi:regulator of RNase E activity RraA